MSDKSPLFVSCLELIAHATELFAQSNPKKYKFVVLHLANAIELLLKDCVVDQGTSIYEPKSSRTIAIWDCFAKLEEKKIIIQERPVIEILIDDRNTIQHRFGYPSAEATYYYIDQTVNFLKRFLYEQYGIHLVDALEPHLSPEHLKLLGLVKDEYGYLDELATISIESSIIEAYNVIERELKGLLGLYQHGTSSLVLPMRNRYLISLLETLAQKGYLSKDINQKWELLREARNYAAHSADVDTSKIDWNAILAIAKELISGLQRAKKDGYTFTDESANDETSKPSES